MNFFLSFISILFLDSCLQKSDSNLNVKKDTVENKRPLSILDSAEIMTGSGKIYLKITSFNSEDICDLLITFCENEWLINGEADFGLESESLEEQNFFLNGVNPLRYAEELFPIESIINNLSENEKEKYQIIDEIVKFKIFDSNKRKIKNSISLRLYSDSIIMEYLSSVKNKDGTEYTHGINPEIKKIINYYCYLIDNNPNSVLIYSVGSNIHFYQINYFQSGICRINKYNFHAFYATR